MKRALIIIATLIGILAAAYVAIFILTPPADSATVTMDGRLWLAAEPEITASMGGAGSWNWRICGVTQPVWTGQCPAGDVPSFGSYWRLKDAIEHPDGRTTFFLDQEGWSYTPPRERAHPLYYLKLAGLLAAAHHVTLIEAPVVIGAQYNTPAKRRAGGVVFDAWAARWAPVVDIQNQAAAANPAAYLSEARQYAKAIRAAAASAHHRVLILDNLSTDPGGHVVGGPSATPAQSAAILHQSYENARPFMDGFWFETPAWTGQGPTPGNCDNSGCPLVAAAFLQLIGATS